MFDTKSSQITRIFLWMFSQTFALALPPLNSAMLSCSSEVTLICMYIYFSIEWIAVCFFPQTEQRRKIDTAALRAKDKKKGGAGVVLNHLTYYLECRHKSLHNFRQKATKQTPTRPFLNTYSGFLKEKTNQKGFLKGWSRKWPQPSEF